MHSNACGQALRACAGLPSLRTPAHDYILDVCTGPAEGGDLVGEALLELQGSQGRAELAILHNHDGRMYSRCSCFPACGRMRVCGGPLGCRTMLPALTASKRHG